MYKELVTKGGEIIGVHVKKDDKTKLTIMEHGKVIYEEVEDAIPDDNRRTDPDGDQ